MVTGKNIIIFGVDNNFSAHADNRQKVCITMEVTDFCMLMV